MSEQELSKESINFGKYKGKKLKDVLRDREYCKWLMEQKWFDTNYGYLYKQISEYKPFDHFIEKNNEGEFIKSYVMFNLKCPDKIQDLEYFTEKDRICYTEYLKLIESLRDKIQKRIDNNEDNIFDIKAPTGWLKKIHSESNIDPSEFKEFIKAYDLPNITSVVETIKKTGDIEYKGSKSFIIAKENSQKQEKFWYDVLKNFFTEDDVSFQYKLDDCFFDFLVIDKKILFESKIGIKDFNDDQFVKYNIALTKYRVIYLISDDCIIDFKNNKLYSTNLDIYMMYNIKKKKNTNYLEENMKNFDYIRISDINDGLTRIISSL